MQKRSFVLFPNLWVDWTRLAVLTQSRLSSSCLSLGADLGCLEDSLLTSLVPGLGRQNSGELDLLGLSVSLSVFLSFLCLFSLFPSPSAPVSVYTLWPALLTLQHVGLSPPEGKGAGRSGEGTTLLKPNPGAGGGKSL